MINRAQSQGSAYHIAVKAVNNFPSISRQQYSTARRQKAQDWLNNRIQDLNRMENAPGDPFKLGTSKRRGPARIRISKKVIGGRGQIELLLTI